MCGIAGYVGLEAGGLGETVLRRMARQLAHPEPDGDDIAVQVQAGVGLVRPVRSADSRYLMAYGGELYNEPELRAALGQGNTTGANLVLAAWAEWGAAALDRCNGRFALAILDTATGELTLARDPVGSAPLYLAADGSGRIAFASEIRAVLAAGLVPRRPDDLTVYRYLTLGVHDDTERTFFDRVTRLLPGELAIVSPTGERTGEVRRETYTRLFRELDCLAAAHRPASPAAREQVGEEIAAAVERRMASEAAAGTSLSGTADLDRIADDLPDLIGCQQQPVGSLAGYADYCQMREASRQMSVLVGRSAASELVIDHLRQAGQPPPSHRFRRRAAAAAPATGLLAADFAAAHRHVSGPAATGDRSAGDLFRHRLPGLLRCQDRNGARFTIRRREPYLDPRLLRTLWSLDLAALRGVTGHLPAPPAVRLPEGWPAGLTGLADELFESASFGDRPYVDQPAVLTAYRSGALELALGWRLLTLELWLRDFIDRDPTLPPASTFVDHYPEPAAKPTTTEAPPPPPADDLITVDVSA